MLEKINKHGGNKAKWTKKEKVEALLLLQRNDFKLSQTANELNINKQTLQYWKSEMGDAVYGTIKEQRIAKQDNEVQLHKESIDKSEDELAIIKAARKINRNDGDLINAIYVAKFSIMDRIVILAKESKNIRDLAYALEILQKATTSFVDPSLESELNKKKTGFMEMVKAQYGVIPKYDRNTTDLTEDEFEIVK